MVLSLSQEELLEYVRRQSNYLFPDCYDFKGEDVKTAFHTALDRMENCIQVIAHPGYHDGEGNCTFSHLHADQYAQFLYFLGNSLWEQSQNRPLCDKTLQMNRVLHSLFLSYKCKMPDHFFLGHPIGTILGNANYHDFLVVTQGVTVNTEQDAQGNAAPYLGKGLFLGAHAKIIGNQKVGDYVSFGVDSMVHQQEIPDNSVVISTDSSHCVIRPRKSAHCKAQDYFKITI